MKHRVKFELYGHKMQTTIEASTPEEAKYLIMGKIKFHEVKPESEDGAVVDFLKGFWK